MIAITAAAALTAALTVVAGTAARATYARRQRDAERFWDGWE